MKIEPGETKFRIRDSITGDKQVEYVARVREFQDTLLDNKAASAVVFASGKPTVLLVDSNSDQTNDLRWALEEQGLLVQVRPVEGVPAIAHRVATIRLPGVIQTSRQRP